MTEKRFTTVELPKPNIWGIWYDGAYLSTYQVCILLNEYVDVKKENEQLKQTNQRLNDELQETMGYLALKSGVEKENEQLKQRMDDVLTELYCKDRKLEELGIDIECCDKKGDVE